MLLSDRKWKDIQSCDQFTQMEDFKRTLNVNAVYEILEIT